LLNHLHEGVLTTIVNTSGINSPKHQNSVF
jgi:hypothetical protein